IRRADRNLRRGVVSRLRRVVLRYRRVSHGGRGLRRGGLHPTPVSLATSPQATVAPVDGLRREAQLLLCCARTVLDDEARRRATSLLSEELDWGYFLRLVTKHRVVPLVHRCLKDAGFDGVPAGTVSILTQQHDHIARRNLF